ncbi:DNA excision repair protein ERCC-4 [Nematocida displodere]|uniref:DNA excision repair protein ERCC-4 n=1 Tax=Nematocida displodere TaxID=1805483 RepID=A0A177EK16_9MICR|nr:DNA excision repair protein ERCC-4 [Nematocida displodere]
MRGYEKAIVSEALGSTRSVHMLFKGARMEMILDLLVARSEERVVIIGAPAVIIDYLARRQKAREMCSEAGTVPKQGPTSLLALFKEAHDLPETLATHEPSRKPANRKPAKLEKLEKARKGKQNPRMTTINDKTPHRDRVYNGGRCVFVSERIFFTDILTESFTSKAGTRVIYLLGDSFLHSSPSIRDGVLFGVSCSISVFYIHSSTVTLSEIISSASIPSKGIFMYPIFNKNVDRTISRFPVNEVRVVLGSSRTIIQAELCNLLEKLDKFPGHQQFTKYIDRVGWSLRAALEMVYSSNMEKFLFFFQQITSDTANHRALEEIYGRVSDENEKHFRYRNCLMWLNHCSIETILHVVEQMSLSEKQSLKEKTVDGLIRKYSDCTLFFFQQNSHDLAQCHPKTAKSACMLRRVFKYLSRKKNPHLVLLDHPIEILRRALIYKSNWLGRNVDIAISILPIKGSIKETEFLSSITEEKNAFTTGIGIKSNRPATIEKKDFVIDPANSNGRVLSIDLHETRASLPVYLIKHFNGLVKFNFSGLKHGDYVANGTYFIERKRIDDLVVSLKNGRIIKQLKSITHFYQDGYLLIEFTELTRTMSLLKYAENNFVYLNLNNQVVEIIRNNPTVKIFFSNSEKASSMLIDYLLKKPSKPESSQTAPAPTKLDIDVENTLKAIPEMTDRILASLLSHYNTIFEIATSTQARLEAAVGKTAGEKIFRFFN